MSEEASATSDDAPTSAAAPSSPPTRRGAPSWVIWAMIVVSTVVAVFASLNAWVEQQLLETENWVEVTDDLLEDDDIRAALSEYLADELFADVDVAELIDEQLPEPLVGLGELVAPAIRSAAPAAIDRLLATEFAAGLWRTANEEAHRAFVAVARGDAPIDTVDGVVVLDLGELVQELGLDLGLEERLGDLLPEDAGQIELFESDVIEQIQDAVAVIEWTSFLLFILVVGLYVGAVYLARGWRREALRGVGISITIAGILVLLLRGVAVNLATNQIEDDPTVNNAVRAVAVIATELLDEIAWTMVVVGLLIFLYALLIGPTRAATTVRRWIRPVARRPILYWAIGVVLLLWYLLDAPVAPRQVIAVLVVIVLWLAGIEVLRQHVLAGVDELPPADETDRPDRPDGPAEPDEPAVSAGADASEEPDGAGEPDASEEPVDAAP